MEQTHTVDGHSHQIAQDPLHRSLPGQQLRVLLGRVTTRSNSQLRTLHPETSLVLSTNAQLEDSSKPPKNPTKSDSSSAGAATEEVCRDGPYAASAAGYKLFGKVEQQETKGSWAVAAKHEDVGAEVRARIAQHSKTRACATPLAAVSTTIYCLSNAEVKGHHHVILLIGFYVTMCLCECC